MLLMLFGPGGLTTVVVRPPRIELGLRVPETLVISLSLRALQVFLPLEYFSVNAFLALSVCYRS